MPVAINAVDKQTSNVPRWVRDAALALNNLITYNNGERSVTEITAAYTVERNDTFIAVDAGVITVTVPNVTDVRRLIIKDTGGNAGTSTITVSGTIDDVASKTLTTNYESISLISDGNQWFTF